MPHPLAKRLDKLDVGIADLQAGNDWVETVPWHPYPASPQEMAYHSKADVLFYGGAAGGGKTDLIIGCASTAHYKSVIFRRQYGQLREIIERSKEILEAYAKLNENMHIWRMPGNRFLEFGAMQREKDKQNWRGRAHDLKAFDEITEFTESQFRFVIGWTRTTRRGQRTRVIATGNPPTDAMGEWVIQYWGPWLDDQHPNPAKPGELRWYATIEGEDREFETGEPFDYKGELTFPKSRTFIPARLQDNPALMATGYISDLQGLPEPLRSQLLYGSFDIKPSDDKWQVIPTEWVRAAQRRWRLTNGSPPPFTLLSQLGVDIARGGAAETVIARRYGTWFDITRHPGTATPDGFKAAELIIDALGVSADAANEAFLRSVPVNIDVIGAGASPYDVLKRSGSVRVCPVDFRRKTGKTDRSKQMRMANLRTWAYWKLREALDPMYGDDIALPPGHDVLTQLCASRWHPVMRNGSRHVQLEDKKDAEERIGSSLDIADAIVEAWLEPQEFEVQIQGSGSQPRY
jgi:hypothetical protein